MRRRSRLRAVVTLRMGTSVAALSDSVMTNSSDEVNTIEEGNKLRLDALALQMPINTGFQNDLVSLDTSHGILTWGNLNASVGQESKVRGQRPLPRL